MNLDEKKILEEWTVDKLHAYRVSLLERCIKPFESDRIPVVFIELGEKVFDYRSGEDFDLQIIEQGWRFFLTWRYDAFELRTNLFPLTYTFFVKWREDQTCFAWLNWHETCAPIGSVAFYARKHNFIIEGSWLEVWTKLLSQAERMSTASRNKKDEREILLLARRLGLLRPAHPS